MIPRGRTSVGIIPPARTRRRNLSALILNSDRAANAMESRNTEQSLIARSAETGPWVAEYGPLAIGNRNNITVPRIARRAKPCLNWRRTRISAVCH